MPRLSTALAVIATLLPAAAWGQQQHPQPQVSPEVREKCRQEVRKLCNFLIPTKTAIRDCIAENKDKFTQQCRAVLSAIQK